MERVNGIDGANIRDGANRRDGVRREDVVQIEGQRPKGNDCYSEILHCLAIRNGLR